LCGSAIDSWPIGGRKKKLNAIVAAPEATSAIQSGDAAAVTRTTRRYASAAVVGWLSPIE
jgi:hypothetical protein